MKKKPIEFLSRGADKLLNFIRGRIARGELARPTYDDIEFALIMSRATIAKSFRELREKGLIAPKENS